MNMNQLECFVRYVETKSFSDVAQQLYLTQPAVTYQITSLEKELGANLFYRTRQGIVPTKPGLVFFEHAKALLERYETMKTDVRNAAAGSDRFIRIGFTRLPNDLQRTALLFQYSRDNGDISLDVNIEPHARWKTGSTIWFLIINMMSGNTEGLSFNNGNKISYFEYPCKSHSKS